MAELPELLTKQEVADHFRVSSETVRSWVKSGKLAGFKTPGGQVRFTREEVQRFTGNRG